MYIIIIKLQHHTDIQMKDKIYVTHESSQSKQIFKCFQGIDHFHFELNVLSNNSNYVFFFKFSKLKLKNGMQIEPNTTIACNVHSFCNLK